MRERARLAELQSQRTVRVISRLESFRRSNNSEVRLELCEGAEGFFLSASRWTRIGERWIRHTGASRFTLLPEELARAAAALLRAQREIDRLQSPARSEAQ